MTDDEPQPQRHTGRERGDVGRPNGKTERKRKLRMMSAEERKAHRKKWKAAQKKAQADKKARVRAGRKPKAPRK